MQERDPDRRVRQGQAARKAWTGSPLHAVLEACRLRLRPILMTSHRLHHGRGGRWCFRSGAGAEMRHAMGVAVFSGMLGVTFFGLMLTPVFYLVIRAFVEKREARKAVFKEARA
ncbi:MAG: efflux RND transporter permease subunit [Stutzerimonas stutzeri]